MHTMKLPHSDLTVCFSDLTVLFSQCTDEFTAVEQPADQVSQCSLDTDQDDVPDYQVRCTSTHYARKWLSCIYYYYYILALVEILNKP